MTPLNADLEALEDSTYRLITTPIQRSCGIILLPMRGPVRDHRHQPIRSEGEHLRNRVAVQR